MYLLFIAFLTVALQKRTTRDGTVIKEVKKSNNNNNQYGTIAQTPSQNSLKSFSAHDSGKYGGKLNLSPVQKPYSSSSTSADSVYGNGNRILPITVTAIHGNGNVISTRNRASSESFIHPDEDDSTKFSRKNRSANGSPSSSFKHTRTNNFNASGTGNKLFGVPENEQLQLELQAKLESQVKTQKEVRAISARKNGQHVPNIIGTIGGPVDIQKRCSARTYNSNQCNILFYFI